MTRDFTAQALPDLHADPFRERSSRSVRGPLSILGGRFRFESNSRELLRVVDSAYAGLPGQVLSKVEPQLQVGLILTADTAGHQSAQPPVLSTISGAGFLAGTASSSSFVAVSAQNKSALVAVSPRMLRFPYHTRYELLEFAVFTLAARVQGLVPLHAACIGREGRGVLLMGPSTAGKSTVALQCLFAGFEFLSEDSVFVAPETMLATGVANFLHVRADSLRWLERKRDIDRIRRSPVIRRRSGVRKFEMDLRRGGFQLAAAPLNICALVFLSAQSADGRPLLQPLPQREVRARLLTAQAYAANLPQWSRFMRGVAGFEAFELRRGAHPLESVETLDRLLRFGTR